MRNNVRYRSVTLENQLKEFKKTILEQIIDTLRCERATLMFIDHHNSEMSAFAAIAVCQSVVRWHGVNYTSALQLIVVDRPPCITCKHSDCRTFTALFPMTIGIASHCATTGERLTVNDPYSDERFNAQIDKDTGFVTRNILCEPVLSRSGGSVLAVLEVNRA
eukprot:3070-Heterococcus_DN1.PRE.1